MQYSTLHWSYCQCTRKQSVPPHMCSLWGAEQFCSPTTSQATSCCWIIPNLPQLNLLAYAGCARQHNLQACKVQSPRPGELSHRVSQYFTPPEQTWSHPKRAACKARHGPMHGVWHSLWPVCGHSGVPCMHCMCQLSRVHLQVNSSFPSRPIQIPARPTCLLNHRSVGTQLLCTTRSASATRGGPG